MAYIALESEHRRPWRAVGDGEAIALVRAWAGAPPPSSWIQRVKVKGSGSLLAKGTVIATFVRGVFPDGHEGHAAIFLGEDSGGIQVIDQWVGQAPHVRTIRFAGHGLASHDAETFYVVE